MFLKLQGRKGPEFGCKSMGERGQGEVDNQCGLSAWDELPRPLTARSTPCRPAGPPHLLCPLPPQRRQILGPVEFLQLHSVHVHPFFVGGNRQCQS